MRFTLRQACSCDAAAARVLLEELGYRVDERELRVGLERAAGAHDAQVIAVTAGEELVGLAALSLSHDVGRLQALVVSEPRRNQGAGRILLAAAEAVASARGCSQLEAPAAHEGGKRFLRRAGFDEGAGRFVKPLHH
jgi:N-acetylglutamate synthase-like GNAT family acetyltransferase